MLAARGHFSPVPESRMTSFKLERTPMAPRLLRRFYYDDVVSVFCASERVPVSARENCIDRDDTWRRVDALAVLVNNNNRRYTIALITIG